jgi:hypothetical protein
MFTKCPACGIIVYRGMHKYCPLCNHILDGEDIDADVDLREDSDYTVGLMDSYNDYLDQDGKGGR